jgi:hypothetical protein
MSPRILAVLVLAVLSAAAAAGAVTPPLRIDPFGWFPWLSD